DEQARGVAADAEGNVYVTGFTSGALDGNTHAGLQDLFLVKYDAAGVKQWTRQLGTSGRDVAQAVATSRRTTGEVEIYVVGRSEGGANGMGLDGSRQRGSYDIVVAKYDTRGMRQWVRQTGTSGEDSASGVTSDGAGNAYVVGSVHVDLVSGASLGSNDLVLLKYDAGGTLLASRQLGSVNAAEPTRASDWGLGVAVDRSRGVYVAGYVEGGFNGETNAGSKDLLLVKYPEGCEANAPGQCARGYGWGAESRWSRQLGTSGDDYSDGVSVSCDGSIYTAGHVAGGLEGLEHAGGLDLFVVKYSPGGTRLWARQLGTPGDEFVLGSTSDASGAVYVVGTTSGGLDGHTSAGDFDLFLVKYDAAGARLWTRQLGSRDYDQASSVTTDAAGNVYVAGVTYGDLDGNINQGGFEGDMFLVKYTADGHKKWTRQFGTTLLDQADGVAVDRVGNVYVAGITQGVFPGTSGLGDQDLVVAKFSAEGGERLWARQLGTSEYDSLGGVATDPNGVVYLSASTYGLLKGQAPAGGVDVLLFKVGSAGDVLWARQLGTEGDDNAAGVATDIAGNLYVTGSTAGAWPGHTNAGELDMMVLKVSPEGTRQWARQIGTPLGEHAEDLAVDARGNVTLGGATFGAFPGGKELGGLDVVVLRYGLVECGNQCGSGCP
ncbi:MAG TPA: SBBP repeat-containing protein, partial [Archangium sp.]|nr:SBBP repeat-containing protein [Archangium sp.]